MAIKQLPTIKQWSYSRWKLYDQCPLKAKFKYIDKLPEPGSPQMDRGTYIHKLAEDFVNGKIKKMPQELVLFAPHFKNLRKAKAECELEWGFTTSWEPTGFMAPDAWLRVKTDVIVPNGAGIFVVIDHKTGKIYDDHVLQTSLYALCSFIMRPEAEQIVTQLWYLDQDAATERSYMRSDMPQLRADWEARIFPMLHDAIFPARPGPHCRYCFFRKANGGPCAF